MDIDEYIFNLIIFAITSIKVTGVSINNYYFLNYCRWMAVFIEFEKKRHCLWVSLIYY